MSWLHLETARLVLEVAQFGLELYDRYVAWKYGEEQESSVHEMSPGKTYRLVEVEPEDDTDHTDAASLGASWLAGC